MNHFPFQPYPAVTHGKSAQTANSLPHRGAHPPQEGCPRNKDEIPPEAAQQVRVLSLTRHSVAIKVISDGLLQVVVRRPLLKPLVEIMPQVFVQSVPCKEKKISHLFISKCTQLPFLIEANVRFPFRVP